jgi:zinc/manganese transport system ATP-binding protein/zinc transport system ATP-binding protein
VEPIVRLDHVYAGYEGKPAIENVSLEIEQGQFVGILGPSGSGKTTLLKTLLGTVPVQRGEITIDGRRVRGPGQTPAGYVPQLQTVDWNFPVTVEEVVMMGRAMHSGWLPFPRKQDRERMMEILFRLGIGDFARRHIRALSGGQQQRVFLARALMRDSKLLLLDEPTTGVDIATRDDVLHMLGDLNREGVTIVLTTHELNAVAAHLPYVVCINRHVIAHGPPEDVFTADILGRTYNAEMHIVEHDGVKFVAESPHLSQALRRDAVAAGERR